MVLGEVSRCGEEGQGHLLGFNSEERSDDHEARKRVLLGLHGALRSRVSRRCLKMGRFHVKMLILVFANLEISGHGRSCSQLATMVCSKSLHLF